MKQILIHTFKTKIYHILYGVATKMNPRVRQYAARLAIAAMLSPAVFVRSDVLAGPDRVALKIENAAGNAQKNLQIQGMRQLGQERKEEKQNEGESASKSRLEKTDGQWGGRGTGTGIIEIMGYLLNLLGFMSAASQFWRTHRTKGTDSLSQGTYLFGATSSFAYMKYRALQGYAPGVVNNVLWLAFEILMIAKKIQGNARAVKESGKNFLQREYSERLRGMEASAMAFRPRFFGKLAELALAPMLAFDRLKGKIIQKTCADWNALIAKTMVPSVAILGLGIIADPFGVVTPENKQAAMHLLAMAGGVIVLGSVTAQTILSIVLKKVNDLDGKSLAIGLASSLGWLAVNIHLGEPVLIAINALWLAIRSPVYYLKAKEVGMGKSKCGSVPER